MATLQSLSKLKASCRDKNKKYVISKKALAKLSAFFVLAKTKTVGFCQPFAKSKQQVLYFRIRLELLRELFLNTGSLTGAITQVVELGTANITATLHFDAGDRRSVELERTFNTFTAGDLTNNKGGVQTAVAASDHNTFVSLDALAGTFNNVHVHDNRVTGSEFRIGLASGHAGDFFLFQRLDKIHFFLQNHHHVTCDRIQCPRIVVTDRMGFN